MAESMARAEVVHMYAALGDFPLGDGSKVSMSHIYMMHNQYLRHCYGNAPDPVNSITLPMQRLARGEFDSLEDPSFLNLLRNVPFVIDDLTDCTNP
jgi:hypothetical protein